MFPIKPTNSPNQTRNYTTVNLVSLKSISMAITVVTATLAVVVGVVAKILFSFYMRTKNSPNRPTLTCFLDSLCEILMFLKIGTWSTAPDIHAAMKIAMKETGLSDWGTVNNFGFAQRYDIVRAVGLAQHSPASGQVFGRWSSHPAP